jgi:hypothetical protein
MFSATPLGVVKFLIVTQGAKIDVYLTELNGLEAVAEVCH